MQNHDLDNNNDDKPLDPAMEKVRVKMVRLLGVSLGVMFIGIIAVLIGVVYKIRNSGSEEVVMEKAQTSAIINFAENLDVVLPIGFNVQGFNLDGSRGAVRGVGSDGVQRVLIVDLTSGKILSTIALRK